jgi:hypothetical protein
MFFGSNNQLFLTLRKQITIIQKTDKKIHDMSSAINEIDMEFKEMKNVNIETIGSLRVTTALSVHGTTVILQGELVNDISSS